MVALIFNIIFDLAKKNLRSVYNILMFLGAIALLAGVNISAVLLVLIAGSVALGIGEIKRRFIK